MPHRFNEANGKLIRVQESEILPQKRAEIRQLCVEPNQTVKFKHFLGNILDS